MTPDSHLCVLSPTILHQTEIKTLAARALSVLAARPSRPGEAMRHHLGALCDAFLSIDEAPRHAAINRILQEGIAPCDIIAHIIPAAARLLGERWLSDEISFAEVTIGTARLQEAVRALVAREHVGFSEPLGTVLLVLPRHEHHSLGVFVAADGFRRLGYDVEFSVAEQPSDIANRVMRKHFVMVGATVSGRRTLAPVQELVDRLHRQVPRKVAVVLGGSAVDLDLDGIGRTGVDHVTSDPKAALKLCGLPIHERCQPDRTAAN